MICNPELHHRRSIRLKGYDYTSPGAYFVTLCTKNRVCLFGDVVDKEMVLNDVGVMIKKWHGVLEDKFPNICCDEHIIMPNHIHLIIQIIQTNVGADRRVCPHGKCNIPANDESDIPPTGKGKHIGLPLQRIIQWFKTMTTNEYLRNVKTGNWHPFDRKLWQRNYYDHIIRNDKDLNRIREYVRSNPANWDTDQENPESHIGKTGEHP